MRRLRSLVQVCLSATMLVGAATAAHAANTPAAGTSAVGTSEFWQPVGSTDKEDYVKVPMPPGVQVIQTELEGPVFADSKGHTLYSWPFKNLRNGGTGDRKKSGESACTDKVYKETSGMMSPYPPGFLLPELDKRPSCVEVWPPFIAPKGAKPVGKWSTIERKDGSLQWAYDDLPLYTSNLDHKAGDVLGGTKISRAGGTGVGRVPVGPPPNIPPELAMVPFGTGHMLVDHEGYSVYTWDGDEPGKSNCDENCLKDWSPVLAPGAAQAQGEWTTIERAPGVHQWLYRKKPLYTYVRDPRTRSVIGSDVPGWHNVYTQRALPPPKDFTVQNSRIGQVLADASGHTIYVYNCSDDAMDQLACDHPDAPQAYRLAICGGGDPTVCNQTFPYVQAKPGTPSPSRLWTIMAIDPKTGHRASGGQEGALNVWAYRGRPVYTYSGDSQPGDANGDAFGEFNGYRNGFKAFWLRDDFLDNAFRR